MTITGVDERLHRSFIVMAFERAWLTSLRTCHFPEIGSQRYESQQDYYSD